VPLLTVTSPQPVEATIDRLLAALENRGIQLLARVEHARAARAVGLELADEQVLIFGNPRVGTLLMQADPTVGYELPMRMLVWDEAGQTTVAYRDPRELRSDYQLADSADVLERMAALLEAIAAEAAAPA
jgi:uncharacterized protein (DUF302 family)